MREIEKRIALLIDADNAPAAKIDEILTELSTLGVINIRRAYGNWTKNSLDGWQEKLLECAIRPIQQFDYSKRKNATDMAMTVDAMELFYADRPDAFGIVSSDADFTPLVMHLRSKGAAVYGFGGVHTPLPFVNACSKFLYLQALGSEKSTDLKLTGGSDALLVNNTPELLRGQGGLDVLNAPGVPSQPGMTRMTSVQLRQDTRLMNLLRNAVRAAVAEDGWAMVSAVGGQIANKTPFDARNYGYASLSKLLRATEAFELRQEGTSHVAVRDKRRPSAVPVTDSTLPMASHERPSENEILSWPVMVKRQNGKALPPQLHGLRSVLLQLAVRKTTIDIILEAVPELKSRSFCALSSVAGRLREKGVLPGNQSALRLLEPHPDFFEVKMDKTPQVIRFLK